MHNLDLPINSVDLSSSRKHSKIMNDNSKTITLTSLLVSYLSDESLLALHSDRSSFPVIHRQSSGDKR